MVYKKKKTKKKKRRVLKILLVLIVLFTAFILYCMFFLPTLPQNRSIVKVERKTIGENFYMADDSWLLKNKQGLWEMYIKGSPLERGNKIGVLSQELIISQEDAFVDQITDMIPSKFMTRFLRFGIGIYNRNLGEYIPEENKEEIFAISQYASPDYGWIGNNYQRIMNYHSAHDIGHAVQLMGFVGCSTLGVWDNHSADSSLLMGRNFDFYVGDKFAENKIVLFMEPDKGYKHALITWGGMIGVVSGMNDQGLSIVLNAAPSSIPFGSATPVSILAREILQYAKNIDEAVAIAEKRKTFVAEQFVIGSAWDNKMAVIEKTKKEQSLYTVNTSYMACANHFQSDKLSQVEESKETASGYRIERMHELVDSIGVFTPEKMVHFLRDKKGQKGENIGLGNEKSIDQLIAHHSIVFQPKSNTFWISTPPYQEGAFIAYNLDSVFSKAHIPHSCGFATEEWTIAADTVFLTTQYPNYKYYRDAVYHNFNGIDSTLIQSNPEFYYTYEFLGNYYADKGEYKKAIDYYAISLEKEIANNRERTNILEKVEKLNKKSEK